MRPLTDKGKQQAKAARSWYNKSVGNKSNKVRLYISERICFLHSYFIIDEYDLQLIYI